MFETTSWDDGLDDAQLAVATHGDSPLVVVAGAGTGKTRALVSRLAYLLERGTPAERILLLTFTRRAADEMLARATALVGLDARQRPRGGTFHAVAHRFLSASSEVLGLPPGFGILDPAEAADLMDLLSGEHGLAGGATRFPTAATLVEVYSRCVSSARALDDVVPAEYPWCEPHLERIADLFRAFTTRKRQAGLLDFDDLLLYWRALLARVSWGPGAAAGVDYVLVDEYQDVNQVQVDIVGLLAPDGRGLTVVGDEAQAIYGFRGADSKQLRELVLSLPGASLIRLERNFRSHQAILDVANCVRPLSAGGPLRLFSERGRGAVPRLVHCRDAASEAGAIVDAILDAHESGVALRDQAVLVRAGHHGDLVELELTARKVPFRKYGGLKFLEAAHVKDFVAASRLLDNPHDDVALYRILRLHRGIGPRRARDLVQAAVARKRDALVDLPELPASVPLHAQAALSASLGALRAARGQAGAGPRAEAVLGALRPLILERYANAATRLGDLGRLVGAAAEVGDFAGWLADLTLDPPVSTGDLAHPPSLDEDYVVLSTIHSAKGLEWSIVHLAHLIDGAIPLDMALGSADGLEEERRLFYVAVTRARDELHLYSPLRLPHHRRALDDRHSYAQVSRFVDGQLTTVLRIEEQVPPGRTTPADARGAPGGLPVPIVVDLDPLWRTPERTAMEPRR